MKKHYKILLYLIIGCGVFLFFWSANGNPAFTPKMAMRKVLRKHLVEDTELLLMQDGDNAIINAVYKNAVYADEESLYYCELDGDPFLPWFEPGFWETNSTLRRQSRGETISFILGNEQYRWRPQVYCLPLYLLPEDEALHWNTVEATLTFDYRNLGGEWEYDCAMTYTASADRAENDLITLCFTEDVYTIDGPYPEVPSYLFSNDNWEQMTNPRSYYSDDWQAAHPPFPITLTITLYDGDTAVYTETHDLT